MQRYLYCICMFSCLALAPFSWAADEGTPPSMCTKEELMSYFPPSIVTKVLVKHDIPQDKAKEIATILSQRGKNLEKTVEQKAAKLDPNPFKETSQREVALKIYREALFEIFNSTLAEKGINDPAQAQVMLDEIQSAKSKLFIDCIRKEKGH